MEPPTADSFADPRRLGAIQDLALTDPSVREALDRLTQLATRVLKVPTSLVTLVEEDRQRFLSAAGLDEPLASQMQTPLSHSFCRYAVAARQPLVVDDAREHPLFHDNPAVGEHKVISYAGIPLITAEGHALGTLCVLDSAPRRWTDEQVEILRDLAAGALTEIELRRAVAVRARTEARYQRLIQTAPETIYVLDPAGRFTDLNPAGERLLARTRDEVLGRHFLELVAERDHASAEEASRRILEGACETVELELHVRRPEGDERLLCVTATATREDGHVDGLHGIARDITQERHAQAEVELLATVLENIGQGVTIYDATTGERVFANHAFHALLGIAPDEVSRYAPGSAVPDEAGRIQRQEIFQSLQERGEWEGRIWRRRHDNEQVVPLDVLAARVEVDGGWELNLFLARDASAEIEREQHLRRAERLASIGTLVGGVAHELNNPLHAILGFTKLLLMDPRSDEERQDLETVVREAERMAKIVADLRLLARRTQEATSHAVVDLNDVVHHILKVRDYVHRTSNIEIRLDLAEDLPPAEGDRAQLEQVVLNLIVNAEQALKERSSERRLILRTRQTPRGISLQLVDNGHGIAPEHLERIYDPFFTTRSPGEGTGLGLSLVHGIVSEHGGQIHVDSQVGTGTAVRVDLPASGRLSRRQSENSPDALQARPLHVLVVDDEESIRSLARRYLSRRGHQVAVASEGEEALHQIGEQMYDVILSDLRMPGLSGDQLLTYLKDRGMSDRLILLTGDAASADVQRLSQKEGIPVLLKPLEPSALGRAVEERAAPMRERSPTP